MDLSQENLQIDRDTLERSNPIFNTAKSTTYQIAMSGDPDALKLVEALGMTKEATQGIGESQLEVVLANDLQMETRYRTMMAMALDSGCKTEVDLPCGYTPRAQWTDEAQDVCIDAQLEKGVLKLTLDGRVDSLSAPRLLALYERAKESGEIQDIRVDCEKLSYISSAGLRILLIMTKAHPDHVVLSRVGDTVMEIFETTGFVDFLKIEQ